MQDTPKKPGGNTARVFDRFRVGAAVRAARGLQPLERLVLHTMLEFSNPGHATVWPSQETLARETGLCRRTLSTIIKNLVKTGVLVAAGTRRNKNGSPGPEEFRFGLDALATLATVEKPRSGRGGYRPKRHAVEAAVSGEVPAIHERANDALDADDGGTGTYP